MKGCSIPLKLSQPHSNAKGSERQNNSKGWMLETNTINDIWMGHP
jgi:hypothetical protein